MLNASVPNVRTEESFETKFSRINIMEIHTVQLTKVIRENLRDCYGNRMNLAVAYKVAKAIKEAHRLGVQRGRILGSTES